MSVNDFISRLEQSFDFRFLQANSTFGFDYILAKGTRPFALAFVKEAKTNAFKIEIPIRKIMLGTMGRQHLIPDPVKVGPDGKEEKLRLLFFLTTHNGDFSFNIPPIEGPKDSESWFEDGKCYQVNNEELKPITYASRIRGGNNVGRRVGADGASPTVCKICLHDPKRREHDVCGLWAARKTCLPGCLYWHEDNSTNNKAG